MQFLLVLHPAPCRNGCLAITRPDKRINMPDPILDIPARLHQFAVTQPNMVALTRLGSDCEPEESITYLQLDRLSAHYAEAILQRGMRGKGVLIPDRNGVEYLVSFLACLRAGASAITAYPPRANDRTGRLEAIIHDAQPELVLARSESIETILASDSNDITQSQCIAVSLDDVDEQLAAPKASDPNTIAMHQYTSGSTSTPRAVQISHGNLIANLDVMSTLFYRPGTTATVSWLPLFHDMGLIGLVMTSLVNGITAHIMAPEQFVMRPIRWLQAISLHRAAHSGGPNFAFELCVSRTSEEDRKDLDLSCWLSAINGAEPIGPGTIRRFLDAFTPCGFDAAAMQPCYGLAEATLVIATRRPGGKLTQLGISRRALRNSRIEKRAAGDEDHRDIIPCGPTVPNHEIAVVVPNTEQRAAPNETGELWVRGPSVSRGYNGAEQRSKDTFVASLGNENGPWLRTGDIGAFVDGELLVVGRFKDIIIVGGANHYPNDIEITAEHAHADVAAGGCAAFASMGEDDEEEVVLLMEPARETYREIRRDTDEQQTLGRAVEAAVRSEVSAQHAIALSVCMLVAPGTIPRTTSGKVQRRLCQDLFSRGSITPLGST